MRITFNQKHSSFPKTKSTEQQQRAFITMPSDTPSDYLINMEEKKPAIRRVDSSYAMDSNDVPNAGNDASDADREEELVSVRTALSATAMQLSQVGVWERMHFKFEYSFNVAFQTPSEYVSMELRKKKSFEAMEHTPVGDIASLGQPALSSKTRVSLRRVGQMLKQTLDMDQVAEILRKLEVGVLPYFPIWF